MKLLCWNICISMDNLPEVANLIKEGNYDIAALQEVLKPNDDGLLNLYPHSAYAPLCATKEWHKHGKPYLDFGVLNQQGNLVLSKHEILDSSAEFYHLQYQEHDIIRHEDFEINDTGRPMQTAIIKCGNKKVQVINIHGLWTAHKNGDHRSIKQCEFIIEKAQSKNLPTIIAGDFNLLPNSESIQLMNKSFRNLIAENGIGSTMPSAHPERGTKAIDFIFVNDAIKVNSFQVIDNGISDHTPLVLDFDII